MANAFNPLEWVKSTQDWFRKTERSSGFRPYLIFLIVHTFFALGIFWGIPKAIQIMNFMINTLYLSYGGFVLLFAVKAFQDPQFCRSEKHVENVKRLELMDQKGSQGPIASVEVIANPHHRALPASEKSEGGAS